MIGFGAGEARIAAAICGSDHHATPLPDRSELVVLVFDGESAGRRPASHQAGRVLKDA
jgi:hypothetical protein